jgi:hypothetical protein
MPGGGRAEHPVLEPKWGRQGDVLGLLSVSGGRRWKNKALRDDADGGILQSIQGLQEGLGTGC